ncbi:hypothetical protein [Nonomuraea sp. NPDC049695]
MDVTPVPGRLRRADTTTEQDLSLAGWDNEGGQTQQLASGDHAS